MITNAKRSISEWVDFLVKAETPVLRQTKTAIEQFKANIDAVSVRQLSAVVQNDPMMAVKVLSLVPKYQRPSQTSDVTTIGRVVMMVGIYPFFQHFDHLVCIEDILKDDPEALSCVLSVINRARFAAQYAYDWAKQRFDIDSFEVEMATLLNSTAEIMLWCFAPTPMETIRATALKYRHMRSARIQQYVLGFPINELQKALAHAWQLPGLLVTLLDQQQANNPRVRTVTIATDLARHSANGLDDPALPEDYLNVANLLGMEMEDVLLRIEKIRGRMTPIQPDFSVQENTSSSKNLIKSAIDNGISDDIRAQLETFVPDFSQ